MATISRLSFFVNGKEIVEHRAEPEWTLLWYLRNSEYRQSCPPSTHWSLSRVHLELTLTGSKIGCAEGGCGACTVLVSRCIDRESGEIEHRTVNACLASVCSVDGCHVVTVEGLGSVSKSNIHPAQARVAELFGSQCGFCTPGVVMSLYGTLASKSNSSPTMQDIEEGFDGNLCRCTGYRPILDAGKTFACDTKQLPNQRSSPKASTTLDKCLSYAEQNSSSIDQVKFPDPLRTFVSQSMHIKGKFLRRFLTK